MNESTNLALDQTSVSDSLSRSDVADSVTPRSGHIRLVTAPATKAEATVSRGRRHLPLISIEQRLSKQRELTAVEQFSARHETETLPAQAKYYRDLLPQTKPLEGEQLAFEVDLDRCTGCKACVTACHSANGLDDTETWRKVGLIQSEVSAESQVITSSCHHCLEPACQKGCPVNAYEKDAITGVVKHLDDQCIGCQYCTLMCPYDAPKFSQSRGIVRKCDMCSQRLAANEAPACVQACPNEAIRIRVVPKQQVLTLAERGQFVEGAPSPEATKPSTRYRSARSRVTDAQAVDRDTLRVEPAHWPLVVMLTLTQLGTGTIIVERLLKARLHAAANDDLVFAAAAMLWTAIALAASVFHLGRPQLAFRAVMNLRTSWLSREALAFGLCAKSMAVYLVTSMPLSFLHRLGLAALADWHIVAGWAAVAFGFSGVTCSVMVYVATQRAHWRWSRTGTKFLGSTLLLGAANCSVLLVLNGTRSDVSHALLTAAMVLAVATGIGKLLFEAKLVMSGVNSPFPSEAKMVRIMLEHLRSVVHARFVLGGLGMVALLIALSTLGWGYWFASLSAVLGLVMIVAGELMERSLFFRAAPGSRMPGAL